MRICLRGRTKLNTKHFTSILGILLVLTSSVSAIDIEQQNGGSIITVDDEGDGDYISIKEALAHANPGDTIEVYSGTYYEHDLDINLDGITLKGIPHELGNGSDKGKPFVDGQGEDVVFLIYAKNVTLDGFHIENEGGVAGNILALSQSAVGCIISNNDLANSVMSSIWVKGSNIKIINNNISHSLMRSGICLRDPSTNNLVSGNVISDCEDGIVLWDSSYNLIEENIIHNCSRFGIDNTFNYNMFQNNVIKDNPMGYHSFFGMYNTVTQNNFINNQVHAQYENSRLRYLITNKWIGNYWDRGRILPYPIRGSLFIFPWIQFDWRPALLPNQIT